jgi:hypothetical protein
MKDVCLHSLPVFFITQLATLLLIICFDFIKQNSARPIVLYILSWHEKNLQDTWGVTVFVLLRRVNKSGIRNARCKSVTFQLKAKKAKQTNLDFMFSKGHQIVIEKKIL